MNTNEIKAEEKKVEEQAAAQVENKKKQAWWKNPAKITIAAIATAAAVGLGFWGYKKAKANKAANAVKESVTAEETTTTETPNVEEKEVRRDRNNGWTERNRERNSNGWNK